MKKNAIRADYLRFSDRKLVPFTQGLLSSMTGNARFPEPSPRILDVQTAFDAYLDAIPARNARNGVNSAIKREKKGVLVAMVRDLQLYVEATARGNLEALESSGYTLQDARQPVGLLPAATILRAVAGPDPGSLLVNIVREAGTRIYEVQVSRDGVDWPWGAVASASKVRVTGLPVEEKVWVRARLHGAAGEAAWSQPMQARVG